MSILPKNSQLIAGDLKTIPATCKPYQIGKIQNADCYGVYKTGLPLPGIYDIGNPTRSVRCLENGWTTIQHRGQYGNPKDYFAKPWAEYVEGFGTSGRHLNIFIYFFIENKNINEGHLSSQSAVCSFENMGLFASLKRISVQNIRCTKVRACLKDGFH